MKKVLLIMAAALMTMTQCRKQETVPATPSADTIKMTITAGSGAKTDINTETGAITWSDGDKLYVSDGTKWLGSLTLQSGAGNASGTFTGNISEISNGTTCHFFYLGHDNGMTGATVGENTNAVISFASQDGSREGALKYHLGHGSADVTVSEGAATGTVAMRTEIAMAHLKLKMDGADYKGSVTMDVSNTMTVSPAGDFSGSGNGITIAAGTSGDRYVTLIPTEATSVSFSGSATGSMTFGHGIQANNLYGMENGIEVTLTKPSYLPGEFTINSSGTKVKFSKGNLWWDGKLFHFEENQWGTQPASNGQWVSDHVSHFKWSNATNAVTGNTTYSGTLFCASNFTVDGEAGWRTLSKDEWTYLINTRSGNRFAKAKVSGVTGLLIFPDVYSGTTSGTGIAAVNTTNAAFPSDNIPADAWTGMESAGVVFLPAAGHRNGSDVDYVGSSGNYWSSTPKGSSEAYCLYFYKTRVDPQRGLNRDEGFSVRLVR